MSLHRGQSAHDGLYPSSSPTDPHDPFNQNHQRYYDNESEQNIEVYRRDTFTSDSSNPGDQERYYDQNGGTHESYREQLEFHTFIGIVLIA
jgi:hypothetical protein